jgi:hypothetical protein
VQLSGGHGPDSRDAPELQRGEAPRDRDIRPDGYEEAHTAQCGADRGRGHPHVWGTTFRNSSAARG